MILNNSFYCCILLLSFAVYASAYGQEENSPTPPAQDINQLGSAITSEKKKIDASILEQFVNSIIYNENDITNIQKAIEAFETGVSLKSLLGEETIGETIEDEDYRESITAIFDVEEEEAPVFYLGSILFISEDQWTIWLNNNKISSDNPFHPLLKIYKVSNGSAVFVWNPKSLSRIVPGWKKYLAYDPDSNLYTNNSNILVDGDLNTVSFVLRPNQSFDASLFNIIEGKSIATTIEVTEEGQEVTRDDTKTEETEDKNSDIGFTKGLDYNKNPLGALDSKGQLGSLKEVLEIYQNINKIGQ